MKAPSQIFLSYAREDEEKVENLYRKLSDAEFKPWMDKKDILPGEIWQSCIQRAIRRSDFFLACLSAKSVNRRGFLQREIKDALDIWQEMLEDDIYLIPVRLEDCEVPESLRDFQWVNLFEEDGWTRLVEAIQVGVGRRAEVTKPIVQESTPFEPYLAHEKPFPGAEMATPEEGSERVHDVFISYSHHDGAWVRHYLLLRLESAGLRVCIDFRDFEIGVPSLVNMERAVERSGRTLLVLTPNWVKSEWTHFEALLVQTDDPIGLHRRILPLMLERCKPPKRIAMLQHADFTNPDQWDEELKRVVATVKDIPAGGQGSGEEDFPSLSAYTIRFSRMRWDEPLGALIAASQDEPLVELMVEHLERVWRHLSEYACVPGTQFDQSQRWLEGTKALEGLSTVEPSMPAAQVHLVRIKKEIANGLSQAATSLYAGQHWREACILLEQVLKIEPDHRAAQEEYRRAIKRWQRARSRSRVPS